MPRTNVNNFSKRLADEVATPHNQHRIIIIEGKTGTGKSNAAHVLAYNTSVEFSKRLGGKPEDYFTLDNTAIISEDELIRVGQSIKKYGIYILDDIGYAFGAREWQSKGNKILGYIMQTFRTYNNVLIMTVPDREFIDKIGRNLVHYKINMTKANFDMGFTYGSISTVLKKSYKDNGGNMYPYIREPKVIYTGILFHRAPVHIINDYEVRRASIQKAMQEEKFRELAELVNGKKNPHKNVDKYSKVSTKSLGETLARETKRGVYPSLKAACEENGLNYDSVKQVVRMRDVSI